MKKIIIKIGTNVISKDNSELDYKILNNIVTQVVTLIKRGVKVIIVTSGAMGAGREIMEQIEYANEIERRQVLSSVGQSYLMTKYNESFSQHGIKAAQILLTRKDFSDKEHQHNLKECLNSLWKYSVIPIVNENDATSIEELMFTDNDQLSGLLSKLIGVDTLLVLTNVDGVYDRHPKDGNAKLISQLNVNDCVDEYIDNRRSEFGRGGMKTKIANAQKLARLGVNVCILNGKTNDLNKFINGKGVGTLIQTEDAEVFTQLLTK